MKQGDIVVVPFPFTDLTSSKLRPALVISNSSFNTKKNVVLLAISTKSGVLDFAQNITQQDLEEGLLKKESFIRFHNILSLEKRLVVQVIGKLKKQKIKSIIARYQKYFEIL